MAGAKESPRQKMIGLMYLVLMALLAMNVSKEVINAFITMNNNLEAQNISISYSNRELVDDLELKYLNPQLKGKPKQEAMKWFERGLFIHEFTKLTANFFVLEADEMLKLGDDSRSWIEQHPDGFYSIIDLMAEESDYARKDDYDIPTYLFVGDDHQHINSRGLRLVQKLHNYRDSLCILIADKPNHNSGKSYYFIPPTIVKLTDSDTSWLTNLDNALGTVKDEDKKAIVDIYRTLTLPQKIKNHGEWYPWQAAQFDHAPIVAAAGVFTSIKGRILQAEQIALNNLNSISEKPLFKFNTIEPLAFAASSYINKGDSLPLSIMIAAFDSTEKSQIRYWINDSLRVGNPIFDDKNRILLGGNIGRHRIDGEIAVETKNGVEWQPWNFSYTVGAPTASISQYDLNVLYSGLPNKIKVAAGGFPPDQISATCMGCESFVKSGEFYIAKVKGFKGVATIKVTARDESGQSVMLASEDFRIFKQPKPDPKFGGVGFEAKVIQKSVAENFPLLKLEMDGPINVDYKVTSFALQIGNKSGGLLKATSEKITPAMKDALKNAPVGTRITFTNIRGSSGGPEIPIPDLSLELIK
jgi:gliding motility-associated protein GldM